MSDTGMSDAGSTTATSSLEDAASSGFYAEILLASFAALLIEINYTRVLSFKLYYYYTFLVVGLSLLGIGVGGVVVTISSRLRRASTESIVMWSLLVGAASVGAGYLVVALTTIDTLAIWDYGASRSFSNTARLVVICIGVFTSFIAIGVLIATLLGRRSEAIGRLYFADLLGAGLACAVVVALFFEIALIQRLTLFLGYPTYSLTVTLMSILIFTGIGALLSTRLHDKVKHLVPALVVAITLLTAFYQFALDPATDALLHLPLAARVPIALIALAPLGLCLGMFMPLGLRAISDVTKYPSQYVAWGWAVNGFASVVGAVLSTILAMSLGFRTVMLIALITYFVALTALRVLLRASSSAPAAA